MNWMNVLLIAIGSGLGGATRYIVSKFANAVTPGMFPWGTMTVNVLGCLVLGLVCGWLSRHTSINEGIGLFLTVGFCGGFTTFSTFMNENFAMLESGNTVTALIYTAASLTGGLILLFAGYIMAR